MPNFNGVWSLTTQLQYRSDWPVFIPELGLFAGTQAQTNIIQYITITTTGDSLDWGDLTAVRQNTTGCASTTRGVFGGGETTSGSKTNIMDYITFASA